MSGFCFECFKKYFDENAKIENLAMDDELDLCEGCGKYKLTVIKVVEPSILSYILHYLK